jgi:putative membrane protein
VQPETPAKDAADTTWSLFSIVWRGLLMGLAEVVPGVSGGTMAFITGIYYELVRSLASFGPSSFSLLTQPRLFAQHHNLRFLCGLAVGMIGGALLFAQVMDYLLEHYQPVVWGFFSGVIAMSVVIIGRARALLTLLSYGVVGLVCGIALLWLPTSSSEPVLWMFFIGGIISVCAWLLPAVSGSYMLLAMGLYPAVVAAIAEFDFQILAVLLSGCAVGLLLFSKSLAWLLRHYQEPLLALLTGFMLGSIANLWPWQQVAEVATDKWLSPAGYASVQGTSPFMLLTAVAFLCGAVAIAQLDKYTSRP